MGLRFVLGPSGFGKSTYVQQWMTGEASAHREREYFMIVPDQFTMQTQGLMAGRNPDGGILNIDVLSFGRLTHRIFEEVGKPDLIPLDDLGKCLVLRRVIHEKEGELKVLKKGIHSPGYVEEVKSVLSEFMQYGIRPGELALKIKDLKANPALKYKLEDLLILYKGFEEALENKYTTREETLYQLCERIPLSKTLPKTTMVFDGFTGFTPIQVNVIATLLEYSEEVIVTLPFGAESAAKEAGQGNDCSDLFYLTHKTIRDLTREAENLHITVHPAVFLCDKDTKNRFDSVPAIAYLERNLFRQSEAAYPWAPEEIKVCVAGDETHECMLLCREMFSLIEEKKYRYRDMAVVCGNLNAYKETLKKQFEKYDIPYFMDSTTELILNPFVAFLRSLLLTVIRGYDYEDVFSVIKSPFSGFDREEADKLENYVLAKNIRGKKAWNKDFTALSAEMKIRLRNLPEEEEKKFREELLSGVNDTRRRFAAIFEPFLAIRGGRAATKEWMKAFYQVITSLHAYDVLTEYADIFEEDGDIENALIYRQVYKHVMELFDQVVSLIGDEEITLEELSEVLDTGYGEIRIGIIPGSVDVLPVCDLIRSRFGDIKALFFIGVNDGNIPSVGKGGGILSDMERTVLLNENWELSPDRAMESFAEQLYLYQILTKPSERLYLSYLTITDEGDSRTPSYLIFELKKMFPKLEEKNEVSALAKTDADNPEETFLRHLVLSGKDLRHEFSSYLGAFMRSELDDDGVEYTKKLYATLLCDKEDAAWAENLIDSAMKGYRHVPLEEEVAREIYEGILKCSVSSLEKFAGCAYAHFLSYGLSIDEREDAGFNAVDYGNITHNALEIFGKYLQENGEEFAEVAEEKTAEIIDEIAYAVMENYDEGRMDMAKENAFLKHHVRRVIERSVKNLKLQLKKGHFKPAFYEEQFKRICKDGIAEIRGKIDRIDLCDDADRLFVKIVDYKSGGKDFEKEYFENGVQLQMVVYLNEAIRRFTAEYPDKEVKPAAMLYYRMQDPFVMTGEADENVVEKGRNIALRPTGLFVASDEVLNHLETERADGPSEVIPVKYTGDQIKTGDRSGNNSAVTEEQMGEYMKQADEKVVKLSTDILAGNIDVSPLRFGEYNPCKFCKFKPACGFDLGLEGYKERASEYKKPEKKTKSDSKKGKV